MDEEVIIKAQRLDSVTSRIWDFFLKDKPQAMIRIAEEAIPSKVRKALSGRSKVFFFATPNPNGWLEFNVKRQAPYQDW